MCAGINQTSNGSDRSLAGPNNDSRLLQLTAPVQSGNSGGPLIGIKNKITGIVVAELDQVKVFAATGSLTQNVNFAIKGLILQTLLDLNGVEYDNTKIWNRKKSTEAIAESAQNYVRQITCH